MDKEGYNHFCRECQIWCQVNNGGLTKDGRKPRITAAETTQIFHFVMRKHKENEADDADRDGNELYMNYPEFLQGIIRGAQLKYGRKEGGVGLGQAFQALIHNNLRFARGGSSLQNRDTKIKG